MKRDAASVEMYQQLPIHDEQIAVNMTKKYAKFVPRPSSSTRAVPSFPRLVSGSYEDLRGSRAYEYAHLAYIVGKYRTQSTVVRIYS